MLIIPGWELKRVKLVFEKDTLAALIMLIIPGWELKQCHDSDYNRCNNPHNADNSRMGIETAIGQKPDIVFFHSHNADNSLMGIETFCAIKHFDCILCS